MIKLFVGECAEFMQNQMEAESVDLTVTSPPYDDLRDYNGYTFDFKSIANQLYRITKQGGVVVWVVADKVKDCNESGTSFRQVLYFKEIGFNLFDTMIYARQPRGAVGTSNLNYFQCFEYMFVLSKGKPKSINLIRDRANKQTVKNKPSHRRRRDGNIEHTPSYEQKSVSKRRNIWEYATGYGSTTKDKIAYQHPAVFPEKLAEDHILSWSNEDDLVFDPMCGSGTTGKMALKHNRQFIGVDISAEYIEIAKKRIL